MNASTLFLMFSASLVGLIHSLSPGHWLPVVLMTKSKKWPLRTAILAALVASAGHIIVSSSLGIFSIFAGAHLLSGHTQEIEKHSGYLVAAFGILYAILAYFRHIRCDHDEHHHPLHLPANLPASRKRNKAPFLFLFSLGFSPCLAVLPIFVTSAPSGSFAVLATITAFSSGVMLALVGATCMVCLGFMKLDHPVFEHYGDVITGVAVALMGVFLLF